MNALDTFSGLLAECYCFEQTFLRTKHAVHPWLEQESISIITHVVVVLKISCSLYCCNIWASLRLPSSVKRKTRSPHEFIHNFFYCDSHTFKLNFLFRFRTWDSVAFSLNKSLHLKYRLPPAYQMLLLITYWSAVICPFECSYCF
jgi:hypothetical protein